MQRGLSKEQDVIIIISVLAFIFVLLLVYASVVIYVPNISSSDSNTSDITPIIYKINESISVEGISYKVTNFERRSSFEVMENLTFEPDRGEFVYVEMTISYNGLTDVQTYVAKKVLLSADGFAGIPAAETYMDASGLGYLNLSPGEIVNGYLLYDIPKGLSNLRLSFSNTIYGEGSGEAYISLSGDFQ